MLIIKFAIRCYIVIYRINQDYVIKVSDFGLSEDVYTYNYFRQSDLGGDVVKLPVKWMAPESLADNHFSEKSDVVSVTLASSCIYIDETETRSEEEAAFFSHIIFLLAW